MSQQERVRAALRCSVPGCTCQHGRNVHCPNVERHRRGDRQPSLTVDERDGVLLVHCKAGCPQETVLDALRRRGLLPSEKPVAVYDYRDASGKLIAQKARFETVSGKTFRWKLPHHREWLGLGGLRTSSLPLWGAELVAQSAPETPVIVVEGEKAAQACRDHGLLAVTLAGGASTHDFGSALEILHGRHVILWPDNDEPGHALMQRIAAHLRPHVKRLVTFSPPLPPKGDAFDFFAGGGSAESVLGGHDVPSDQPSVEIVSHDEIVVRVPTAAGDIRLTFREFAVGARAFDATVMITLGSHRPYEQRINTLSMSQRAELRRELEAIYGKDVSAIVHWPEVIHQACSLARETYLSLERAVSVAEIAPPGPLSFLIDPLLPYRQPTLLFGDGASGKTYLSLGIAVAVASGLPFLGLDTRPGKVLFIDFECTPEDFRRRIDRIAAGFGLDAPPRDIFYWASHHIPLVDQVSSVLATIKKHGIQLVIIDSLAAATAGATNDVAQTISFWQRGVKALDVTTLVIAHITKQSDQNYAFGSIFNHNEPRRTWNVQRLHDENEEVDTIDVALFCRKANDGRVPRPLGVRISFAPRDGSVSFLRVQLPAVVTQRQAVKAKIVELLARSGALSLREIVDQTGCSRDEVVDVLRSFRGAFVQVAGTGEARWGLAA